MEYVPGACFLFVLSYLWWLLALLLIVVDSYTSVICVMLTTTNVCVIVLGCFTVLLISDQSTLALDILQACTEIYLTGNLYLIIFMEYVTGGMFSVCPIYLLVIMLSRDALLSHKSPSNNVVLTGSVGHELLFSIKN